MMIWRICIWSENIGYLRGSTSAKRVVLMLELLFSFKLTLRYSTGL